MASRSEHQTGSGERANCWKTPSISHMRANVSFQLRSLLTLGLSPTQSAMVEVKMEVTMEVAQVCGWLGGSFKGCFRLIA